MHALLDAPLQHLLQLLGCVGAALQCEAAVVITFAKSRVCCCKCLLHHASLEERKHWAGHRTLRSFVQAHVYICMQDDNFGFHGFLETMGRLTMGLFGWHSSTARVGCPSASAAAAAFASAGTQLPSSPGCAQCTGHGLSPAEACNSEAAVVVTSVGPIEKHDDCPHA